MNCSSKVKNVLYGFGALGGGIVCISSVIYKYYKDRKLKTQNLFELGHELSMLFSLKYE